MDGASIQPELTPIEVPISAVDNELETPEPETFDYPKKKHITILILLYTNSATLIGITSMCTVLILNESKSISFTAISVFSFLRLFTACKAIFGVLLDTLYIKSIGKCKTPIIGTMLISSGLCFLYSFFYGQWIHDVNLPMLYFTVGLFLFVLMYNSTAIDVYCLHLLSKKDRSYAGACLGVGMFAGMLIGGFLFINLTSKRWAEKYFGTPQESGIISYKSYFLVHGSVILVLVIMVVLLAPESIHAAHSSMSPNFRKSLGLLSRLRFFLVNPHLRVLSFILATYTLFNAPWIAGGNLLIQNSGITKEYLTIFDASIVPFKSVMFFTMGRLCQKYHPLKLVMFCLFAGVLQNGFGMLSYTYLQNNNEQPDVLAYFIFGTSYIFAIVFHSAMIAFTAFSMKICHDETKGGVFLGGFHSIGQGSVMLNNFLVLVALDHVPFVILQVVFDLFLPVYVIWLYFMVKKIEHVQPFEFALASKEEIVSKGQIELRSLVTAKTNSEKLDASEAKEEERA